MILYHEYSTRSRFHNNYLLSLQHPDAYQNAFSKCHSGGKTLPTPSTEEEFEEIYLKHSKKFTFFNAS